MDVFEKLKKQVTWYRICHTVDYLLIFLVCFGLGLIVGIVSIYYGLNVSKLMSNGGIGRCDNGSSSNRMDDVDITNSTQEVKIVYRDRVKIIYRNNTIFRNVTTVLVKDCTPQLQYMWDPPQNCSNACESVCHLSTTRHGPRRCVSIQPRATFSCHSCRSNCTYTGGLYGNCIIGGLPY